MEDKRAGNIVDSSSNLVPVLVNTKAGIALLTPGARLAGGRFSVPCPSACLQTRNSLPVSLFYFFLTEAAARTASSRQQDRTCTGAAATTKPDPAAAVRRRRNRPERPGHRVFVCLLRGGGGEGVRGGGDRPTKPSSVRWPRRARSILSRVGLIIATLRMRLRSCAWTPLDRGGDGRPAGRAFYFY